MKKRIIGLFLVFSLCFTATPVPASDESFESEPYGKPWVNTTESGNLPEKATEAADDLNLYYNFGILKEHQDGSIYDGMFVTEGGFFSYDDLELDGTEEGGSLLGNYLKLKEYHNRCENELLDKKAVSRIIWAAFGPTLVSANYYDLDNSINIMPGFVTSNLYRDDMADEEVLGGIGSVISHEISHAIDFHGSQKDQYGRPDCLFAEKDADEFLQICDDLAAYYDTIEYAPGKYVDGQRVCFEAIADLNGLQTILAFAQALPECDLTKLFEKYSNIHAFVGYQGLSDVCAILDTHPLRYLRINVNAQMIDGFYDTYGCEEGDGMYPAPESRIYFWGK